MQRSWRWTLRSLLSYLKRMMDYLHSTVNVGPSSCIQICLDQQANVKLMDGLNFQRYRCGKQYSFRGGLAKTSPVNLSPPHSGTWHVVIDLGGYPGKVNASVSVI
jgi:hypothetical protein